MGNAQEFIVSLKTDANVVLRMIRAVFEARFLALRD